MDKVRYPFLIRIRTADVAVIYCLRGLSMFVQTKDSGLGAEGDPFQPWKGTGRDEWERSDGEVTFRFTSLERRTLFENNAQKLLAGRWELVWRDPPEP